MGAAHYSLTAVKLPAHAWRTVLPRVAGTLAIGTACALAACNRGKPPAAPAKPAPPAASPAAPRAVRLPAGISDLRFGRAVRGESTAGRTCRIPQPLPDPATFPVGTRELAFTARLDPDVVKDADATMTGPGLPEVRGTGCNALGVSGGRVQQIQMGSSFIRSDGTAWPSGEYTLSIRVNGASTNLPFRVE